MNRDDLSDRVARMRSSFRETEDRLAAAGVRGDADECRRLSIERGRLASFFSLYDAWQSHLKVLEGNRKLLEEEKDPEFRQLIESEILAGEDGNIRVVTDLRAKAVCPLARQGKSAMDPAFVEAVREAGEILARSDGQAVFLKLLADEQKQLKALRQLFQR